MVTTNMLITNSHLQQSQFYFPSLTKCFINLPDVTNYIYDKSIAKSLILDFWLFAINMFYENQKMKGQDIVKRSFFVINSCSYLGNIFKHFLQFVGVFSDFTQSGDGLFLRQEGGSG